MAEKQKKQNFDFFLMNFPFPDKKACLGYKFDWKRTPYCIENVQIFDKLNKIEIRLMLHRIRLSQILANMQRARNC